MKLSEIKAGEIFTVGNTPSYPKLRTEYGWLDIRDQIKKVATDVPWNLRLLTDEEKKKWGL